MSVIGRWSMDADLCPCKLSVVKVALTFARTFNVIDVSMTMLIKTVAIESRDSRGW